MTRVPKAATNPCMPATPAWPPKSLPRLYIPTPIGAGTQVELDAVPSPTAADGGDLRRIVANLVDTKASAAV